MIATTRGALLRGTVTEDAYGDEVATDLAPVAMPNGLEDFPFSAIERSRNEFDESSNAWRTVRYYAGRIPTYVDAKAGDVIRDERDGRLFTVDEVERMARGLSGRASVTLTMRRTGP